MRAALVAMLVLGLALTPAALGAQPRRPDVGARIDTRDSILLSLRRGAHAVLFLKHGPPNETICKIFIENYAESLGVAVRKVIYFPRRADYAEPAINCSRLTQAYDIRIWAALNEDLSLDTFDNSALMIVCRDASGRFINKGYVEFNSADENAIQAKFELFEGRFHQGPAKWPDGKVITKPIPLVGILIDPLIQGRNTPCT